MPNLIRVQHNGGWAAVPNSLLEDSRVSWRAKGLWAYLHGRPDDWEVREADLVARSSDGRQSVRSALAELEEAGWLTRVQNRDGGQFGNVTYFLHAPQDPAIAIDPPWTRKPSTVEPPTVEPPTANRLHSNKEESKKEENNKESNPNREIFARQAIHWIEIFPERTEPLPKSSIMKQYIAAREAGATEQQLIDAAVGYKHWCKQHDRLGTRYIYSPVSFLRQHWHDWVGYQPEPETRKGSDGLNYLS